MTTCAADKRPVFWQRQPRLPLSVARVLRRRLEAALHDPSSMRHLVWPTILGAPKLLDAHPEGVPEDLLLEKARPLLATLQHEDPPREAWQESLELFPDSARRGPAGWLPHEDWSEAASLVSLRSGVMLLALMGHPADETYPLRAGISLFNSALYHECHDAFEVLWSPSRGRLRSGLQGLILLAAGFHHQQMHHAAGMLSVWRSAQESLGTRDGLLETPWGTVEFVSALQAAVARLDWLWDRDANVDLEPLWELERPTLELVP